MRARQVLQRKVRTVRVVITACSIGSHRDTQSPPTPAHAMPACTVGASVLRHLQRSTTSRQGAPVASRAAAPVMSIRERQRQQEEQAAARRAAAAARSGQTVPLKTAQVGFGSTRKVRHRRKTHGTRRSRGRGTRRGTRRSTRSTRRRRRS